MTDLSICSALSVGSFLMRSQTQASFLLLYSTVSVCIVVCVYLRKRQERQRRKRKLYSSCTHAWLCILVYTLCICMCGSLYIHTCVCVCMHACVFILHCSPHSARHSMYSSALLIAGCWSKIIVIFQPVGLKSYNIMKCIKKRGKWQTGGMLNQM